MQACPAEVVSGAGEVTSRENRWRGKNGPTRPSEWTDAETTCQLQVCQAQGRLEEAGGDLLHRRSRD